VTVIKFVEEFLSIRDTSRPLSDRDRVKVKISMLRICKTSCRVRQAIGCILLLILFDFNDVQIKKALRGVRIETNHQQDQIRRYKITVVTSMPMSQLM
jgi:eukaryotic translation initiation factor 2C